MIAKPRKPGARRRFLRFTLRGVLIAITALCLWLGWRVNRANHQRQAIHAVMMHGGSIKYYDDSDPKNKTFLARVTPAEVIDLVGVDFFRRVEVADLTLHVASGNRLDEPAEAMAVVGSLPDLKSLRLEGPQISDRVLERVANLSAIESLTLCSLYDDSDWQIAPHVSPRGLRFLVEAPNLKELVIEDAALDDRALAAIAEIDSLETLVIEGAHCEFSDDGLIQLARLRRLRKLALPYDSCLVEFTDAGIEALMRIDTLEELQLRGAQITARGFRQLRAKLPAMQRIVIASNSKRLGLDEATWDDGDVSFWRYETAHERILGMVSGRKLNLPNAYKTGSRRNLDRLTHRDLAGLQSQLLPDDPGMSEDFLSRASQLKNPTVDDLATVFETVIRAHIEASYAQARDD